jgi:hypothetical protein
MPPSEITTASERGTGSSTYSGWSAAASPAVSMAGMPSSAGSSGCAQGCAHQLAPRTARRWKASNRRRSAACVAEKSDIRFNLQAAEGQWTLELMLSLAVGEAKTLAG